ncbi:MerR family transcriptional regulator [Microbacterium sp. NPDC056052]|uniref:MerR family transcriptional regulator n=1 Tax=Microbacterium sp. NPDC056052 TaxID=3345695 RepID=UPI0035D92926
MLTIGQLATHAGVTAKAIRVYHAEGLLPEPERDSSGYRRDGAQAIIDLTRIVTVAHAGVPLARIPGICGCRCRPSSTTDRPRRDRVARTHPRVRAATGKAASSRPT